MAKTTAFSLLNTLLVVGLLAAIAATVYNRDAISDKLHNIRNTNTVAVATPTPTPAATSTPAPTATPTPTATPKAVAMATPTPAATAVGSISQVVPGNGTTPLPRSGPELNVILAGMASVASGSGYYAYNLRKKLKRSWQNIDIR